MQLNKKKIFIGIWVILLIIASVALFQYYRYTSMIKDYSNISNTGALQAKVVEQAIVPQKPILEDVLEDENKDILSYHKLIKETDSTFNLYKVALDSFNQIKTQGDFIKFREDYKTDPFFITLIKANNKEGWVKFWDLNYDYKLSVKDSLFISVFENILGKSFTKEAYKSFISSNYDELIAGKKSLSDDDMKLDLNIYFSSLNLSQALVACTTLAKLNPLYSNIVSCEDRIYFYRATKENKYCDKISEDYKKSMCNDYLNVN